jgi:transposase
MLEQIQLYRQRLRLRKFLLDKLMITVYVDFRLYYLRLIVEIMDLAELHLHWGASQYKGKCYRSYSLARPYRENGKNRKEIVMKLGKLSETEVERWRNFLRTVKEPDSFFTTLDDLFVTVHHAYLDVATASAIWDEWELDEAFPRGGKRVVTIATIARILSLNRCIDPAAKSQTPEWFRSTALPWVLDVNPELINVSRIFRELAVIESHKEAICKHLVNRITRDDPGSMISVFYDLSSTTFTGSCCVLMKWGHCKEGYCNHIVLALVVNSDGLPFYWEVLPGGTADSKTIIWLLGRLQERFKIPKTTLIFDRGMVSDDNLTLIEDAGIKYISAMDKSQLEGITGLDFSLFSYLDFNHIDEQASDLPNFTKLNEITYYQEVKVEGKRRYILCFNPEMFKDQRKARRQVVADFRAFVDDLNVELCEAKNSRQRKPTYNKFKQKLKKMKLTRFVDVKLRIVRMKREIAHGSIRTYEATVIVDKTEMCKAGRLDGFWLLVTNLMENVNNVFKVPAEKVITPYRDKVVIESAFRDIKSFIEVKPVRVWKKPHVKAHYTCCVLSYLINRTLTMRLHKNKDCTGEEIVTHEKLYKKLSGCQIDRIEVNNVGLSTHSITQPTNEQKELMERLGLTRLLSPKVPNNARVCTNS